MKTLTPVLGSHLPPAPSQLTQSPFEVRRFMPSPPRANSLFKERFEPAIKKHESPAVTRKQIASRIKSLKREQEAITRELELLAAQLRSPLL